jgi:hypothetical protein
MDIELFAVSGFWVFWASRGPNLGLNAVAQEMKRGRVEYCDDGIGADLVFSEFAVSRAKSFG